VAYEQILHDLQDGILTITLNRPERLNAWNSVIASEVRQAMQAASEDDAVRVIILTGAGRGFCAGADMNTLQGIQAGTSRGSAADVDQPFDAASNPSFQKPYSYFPAVKKPVIAAINGACAGLGLIMTLYCDMRFASDAAVFTTAFSRRGLIAEHGISWLLPRLVGLGNATDLMFSGRKIGAHEAREMGLVNRVIPHDVFMDEVRAYARMLATEVSPRSVREMKRELWNAQFQSLGEAIDAADGDMQGSFVSEDFKEGVAHFLEKRAPAFTGR
jgi:enoyl-CoA hydratase/carnithine racemase